MKVARGDVFSPAALAKAVAIGITTNQVLKRNGEAVMGAGVAKAARDRFPGIAANLGRALRENGNCVQLIWETPRLFAFPTKNDWRDLSTIARIEQSCRELRALAKDQKWTHGPILLPRPGCNNGGLQWEEVQPILDWLLDDRFIICYR